MLDPYCNALDMYCTVLYSTLQYCTILYCTVVYYTVQYCTAYFMQLSLRMCRKRHPYPAQFNIKQAGADLYGPAQIFSIIIVRYSTVQYSTVLYSTLQYSTVYRRPYSKFWLDTTLGFMSKV